MSEIATERLLLRPMRLEDINALHIVFSDSQAMQYWSTLPHADRAETAALVQGTIAADPATTAEFVIELGGRVIVKAGFWRMPEIGYVLHPGFWGQGIMTEALEALTRWGFETRGLEEIMADVDPNNAASLHLLKKLGFYETGRARNTLKIGDRWFDSVYLRLHPPT
jgi:RimJ/RimL family protein N-acetyltransferase